MQTSVDKESSKLRFCPTIRNTDCWLTAGRPNGGSKNGHHSVEAPVSTIDASEASDKQKTLIEKVAKREKFTAEDLEGIAQRRFKLPLAQLDRKQTSGFITELLLIAGPPRFRKASGRPAEANGATA